MTCEGYMLESIKDPEQVTKDGLAYILCEGHRTGSVRFGYSTPTRRRRRKMERRAVRSRRQRWEHVNYHQAKYNLARINRAIRLREIEEAVDQLVAEGKVTRFPDGTFQWNETLADKIHARRERMRGE